jgi:hypothetical protein
MRLTMAIRVMWSINADKPFWCCVSRRRSTSVLASFISLLTLSETATAQATATSSSRPPFSFLRQDEDFSFLRDPSTRSDPFDGVKYLPLGGDAYASFGGSVRVRGQLVIDENQGRNLGRDLRGAHRIMLHGSVKLNQQLRVFSEIKSSDISGYRYQPRTPELDRFDIHQTFVELGIGKWRSQPQVVTQASDVLLRAGRQEISYGAGRMISVRDGPNVRQSFDGLLLRTRDAAWTTDTFAFNPVTTEAGNLDNRAEAGSELYGMYATHQQGRSGVVDLYAFGIRRAAATYQRGVGQEQRVTLGARASQKSGAWIVEGEFAVQGGQFQQAGAANQKIQAWTVSGRIDYLLQDVVWNPSLVVGFGMASGDSGGGKLKTFKAPYPSGRYFGSASNLGPSNIEGLEPSLNLKPTSTLSLKMYTYSLWRLKSTDGLYSPPGQLALSVPANQGRYVGDAFGTSFVWRADRHITIDGVVEKFFAGPVFNALPNRRDSLFAELRASYVF